MKRVLTSIVEISVGVSLAFLGGCHRAPSNPSAVLDRTVSVGPGGGHGDVTFEATRGQKVRITLTGSKKTMEPYGNLEPPDGSGEYFPPNGGSKDGVNTGVITLSQTGRFTLTVFDGSNGGGSVHVVIQRQ
jgi:hypothetical protein